MLLTNFINFLQRNPETQQWPGPIDSFRIFRTDKKDQWVNTVADEDYVNNKF